MTLYCKKIGSDPIWMPELDVVSSPFAHDFESRTQFEIARKRGGGTSDSRQPNWVRADLLSKNVTRFILPQTMSEYLGHVRFWLLSLVFGVTEG